MKIIENCKLPSLKRLQKGAMFQEINAAFKEDPVWKTHGAAGHIAVTRRKDPLVAKILARLPSWCHDVTCMLVADFAWPHTDLFWKDKYIFTLVLEGNHQFIDAKYNLAESKGTQPSVWANGCSTDRGSIFVVDPRVMHWLKPIDSMVDDIFVSLQWEVDRKNAAEFARNLLQACGGTHCENSRYSKWFE
jgi:hypothetical protein